MEKFIGKFERGTQYVNIISAVTANELTAVDKVSDDYMDLECVKFVPASGAATRMFKDLYQYLEDRTETDSVVDFFENLEQFPFYRDMETHLDSGDIDKESEEGRIELIEMILRNKMNYGNLPKALVKMHAYDGHSRTPIDEHIYEGERYVGKDSVKLHFTISEHHEELFTSYVGRALHGKDHIDISHSFQNRLTDTLAVDMENKPFLDENGEVLYRAGGHGSLIENLNDLDGDIIFIKNIDNVCHKEYVEDTIDAKKMLASAGYEVKQQIDSYILDLLADDYDLDEIIRFMEDTLNIVSKTEITKDRALAFLNRPLRVCGMVKNQGEPGGGPFVVDNGDYTDLQICERSEIDVNDEEKLQILNQSRFFNPVNLVCFIRDHKNEKFNLLEFVNQERYFISEKTYKGRKLKALEHPGLWNGAMHNWNTLFVEVPLSTFNPVKTVNDLLRDGHRGLIGA